MSRFRAGRRAGRWWVPLVPLLLLGAMVAGTPASIAADSPTGAALALFEQYGTGDLSGIEDLVCEEQRDAVRAQLAEMTGAGVAEGAFRIEVRDPEVTLVSEDGDTAVVRVVATMAFHIDEAALREMARQSLAASGQEPSDEEIDSMVALMGSFGGQETPVDEEMTVVRRDGQWLACPDMDDSGGFGTGGTSTVDPGNLSQDGLCGVVPIDQLNAIAPAAIGYSFGGVDQCNWSGDADGLNVSLNASVSRGQTLEAYQWGELAELVVADRPALADQQQLYVEVDGGVLSLYTSAFDASGNQVDVGDFPVRAAELIIPALAELPTNPLADCGIIDLAELDALRPVGYASSGSSYGYCNFEAYQSLTVSFEMGATDRLETYTAFAEGEPLEVAGRPAFVGPQGLWVQFEDGLLSVNARSGYGEQVRDPELEAYMVAVAEYVTGLIEAGE